MDSPLLTREEAAEYLRLSPKSLDRLPVPRVKLGRLVRYSLSDLAAYVEGCKAMPASLDRIEIRRANLATARARKPSAGRVRLSDVLAEHRS